MKLPGIIELARGKAVFVYYEDMTLWYRVVYDSHEAGSKTFDFPVPVNDAGGGKFLPEDKALTYMRWIRKHLEMLEEAQDDAAKDQ